MYAGEKKTQFWWR